MGFGRVGGGGAVARHRRGASPLPSAALARPGLGLPRRPGFMTVPLAAFAFWPCRLVASHPRRGGASQGGARWAGASAVPRPNRGRTGHVIPFPSPASHSLPSPPRPLLMPPCPSARCAPRTPPRPADPCPLLAARLGSAARRGGGGEPGLAAVATHSKMAEGEGLCHGVLG